jgi:lysozyme
MAFPAGAVPGIDVSHYQKVVDWPTVAAAGEAFAFAKASEGNAVSDIYFADNWAAIKNAGMMRGAYHFFHPSKDAVSQAHLFLAQLAKANGSAQLAAGDLPVALDLEVTDGVAPKNILGGVTAWLTAVEQATGRRPLLYTYVDFWKSSLGNPKDLSDYPLWISHLNHTSPTIPGGWTTWAFWQFSKQTVHGVSAGVVDVDAFNGTVADLRTMAGYSSTGSVSLAAKTPGKKQGRAHKRARG